MSVSEPTSDAPQGRPGRLGVRSAAAVLALLMAAPLLATVWTRCNLLIRIPKGTKAELEDASYAGRDWSMALTALEVREDPGAVRGTVTSSWILYYRNTDKEPHYVSVTVRCLNASRNELSRFTASATLLANRPDGASVGIAAKMPEESWRQSAFAKIVVDFLSGPGG